MPHGFTFQKARVLSISGYEVATVSPLNLTGFFVAEELGFNCPELDKYNRNSPFAPRAPHVVGDVSINYAARAKGRLAILFPI